MSFASVGIIAACLLITGSFALLALNIDSMVADVESQSEITVFVDETYTEEKARTLKESIMKIDGVKSAEFVSKDMALQEYKEMMGDNGDLMDGLEDQNPLRDGYRIRMKEIGAYRSVAAALQRVDGIDSVKSRVDITEKLIQVRGVIDAVCIGLILMLGAVSVFIISNTVKLATFTRKDEIAIMKMVGATNGFVRGPFIIEGLALAEVGAVAAYFLLWGAYVYLQQKIFSGISFVSLVEFSAVSGRLFLTMLGVGVIIGVLGSVQAIRKFLKV